MNKYVEHILNQLSTLVKRFLPGDLQNRVNQAEMWLLEFRVTQTQEVWDKIFPLIANQGVWQGRTRNFISQLGEEQKTKETISHVKDLNSRLEELRRNTNDFINTTLPQYQTASETVSNKITANYLLIGVGLIVAFFVLRK